MNKFLTKQEVIDKLASLPDLPIVIERDTEVLSSTGITSIEIRECVRAADQYFNNYMEYSSYIGKDEETKPKYRVIWIS